MTSFILIGGLVVGFIVVVYQYFINWLNNNSSILRIQLGEKQLPGLSSLPFFGCAFQIGWLSRKYKSFQVFEHICQKYGAIVGLQIGLQYTVVEDFETAKHILNSEDWQARNPEYSSFLELTFGKQVGLMFAYSDGWKENRRFILRTLKDVGFGLRNKLELDLKDEFQYFTTSFDRLRVSRNNDVCMHRVFKLSSLNVLWRILCGTRCWEDDEFITYMIGRVEDTVQSMGVGCQLQFAFPFLSKVPGVTSQRYQLEGIGMLHTLFAGILCQRRKLGDYQTTPVDFIDFYLKKIDKCAHNPDKSEIFNDEQLIQSCSDMFLAGADTTGNTLEFAMLYMLKFPEVQLKVQAEIDRIVKSLGDDVPNFGDAGRMPYTQAVLLEVVRHATITPIIPRTSIVETNINDCRIPKNTVALVNFYKINHSRQTFGDPENFRPERFLDSSGNLLKEASNQVLQFGLGRRICVGMPMARMSFFTFFVKFMHRYTLSPSVICKAEASVESIITGINNQPMPYNCTVKLRHN